MEQNNNKQQFTISIDDRIVVTPKYRLCSGAFSWFKSHGWKWSPSRQAFVFNVNEEGAKRVLKLTTFDMTDHTNEYFGNILPIEKEDAIEELTDCEIVYEGNAGERINELLMKVKEKQEAEQAHKKQREERIGVSRVDRGVKLVQRLKQLKNGFTASMFDMSLSNFNMSDLLARRGVSCQENVKELLERYGLPIYEGAENDYLIFSIGYANVYANKWSSKVAAKRLCLNCDHYEKTTGGMLGGGSGHFAFSVSLHADETKIDFKKVVIASSIADDDCKRCIAQLYLAYRNGETMSTGYRVTELGMMSKDMVLSPTIATRIRERFNIASKIERL